MVSFNGLQQYLYSVRNICMYEALKNIIKVTKEVGKYIIYQSGRIPSYSSGTIYEWHKRVNMHMMTLLALFEGNPQVTNVSDGGLWCFLLYVPEQTVGQTIGDMGRHGAHYDSTLIQLVNIGSNFSMFVKFKKLILKWSIR